MDVAMAISYIFCRLGGKHSGLGTSPLQWATSPLRRNWVADIGTFYYMLDVRVQWDGHVPWSICATTRGKANDNRKPVTWSGLELNKVLTDYVWQIARRQLSVAKVTNGCGTQSSGCIGVTSAYFI